MKKIIIINGPNLNLLGNRENSIYGNDSLDDIKKLSEKKCLDLNLKCFFYQSNNEGEIINNIQDINLKYSGLIINPAAFTHTSVAILDALRSVNKPKIEIHLSNIYAREDYRRKSITSEAVNGVICGFGENGYVLAIDAIKNLIYSEIK